MTHPIGPWEVVEEMSYSMRRQWFLRRDNKNTKWPFGQEPLLTPKHRKRLFLSPEKAKAHADKLNAAAGVAGAPAATYEIPCVTENRKVIATDCQPSDEPGAWTCKACGFRGFWRGGPHCTAGVRVDAPAGPAPEDSYPDQTVLHDERNVGNCLQATIAGVLGWPLAAVPHFALLGEDHWWDCAQAWLNSQGYWIDYKPTSYADEGGELLPRCWLSGRSPRGFSHAVIGDAATLQMLHDPHPSRAGLLAVDYTIYFFRKPARGVAPSRDQLTAMVDAAMVEMSNIHPPLRRSECERLIRAALGVGGTSADQPASPADQAIYDGMADRYQRERTRGVAVGEDAPDRCHAALMGREKCAHFCGAAQCNAGVRVGGEPGNKGGA